MRTPELQVHPQALRVWQIPPCNRTDTTASGHENLGLGDIHFVLLLLDLLYKSHFDLGVVKLGLKTYYRACTAGLGVTLGHHTGTDCGHLGTVLRTHDGGHEVAAESGTGHHQLLVLGYLQLGAVSGETGCQTG